MSWLFSQALVAEYSQATAWAGAPCAQLNVMPTQHKFWRNDKTVEPCDLSRFGLTCAALTEDRGADLLTWFREASRARTSASQAKAQASTEPAAECGPTWRGSLARFDRASSSWRTAQPSLLGDLDECSVTWPRSGMTAGGLCWELPTLERPTAANDSGLWVPTPCATDARPITGGNLYVTETGTVRHMRPDGKSSNRGLAASAAMWPTPTSSLGTNGGRVTPAKAREGGTLIEALSARTFATPTARDWRSGKASQATHDRNSRPLSEQIGGLLNPEWVEWLMNWPIGWTDLKHSATARCPDAQPQLSAC